MSKIIWHSADEKPSLDRKVIVENDGEIYIETINKNFDEWGDRVSKWSYIDDYEKDKKKEVIITDTIEYSINLDSDDAWKRVIKNLCNALRTANDSWKCNSDGDTLKEDKHPSGERKSDGAETNERTRTRALYHQFLRDYLDNIENGKFDLEIGDYRRIAHIFECRKWGVPIAYSIFTENDLWEY